MPLAKDQEPSHHLGGYASWKVPVAAKSLCDQIWIYRSPVGKTLPPHRLLPTSEPNIAIIRNRKSLNYYEDVRLIISGPSPEGSVYAPAEGEEMIALRLMPEICGAEIGIDPKYYGGRGLTPAPRELDRTFEAVLKMASYCTARDMGHALHAVTVSKLKRGPNARAVEHGVARLLRATRGRAKVRDIVDRFGHSERHIRRLLQNTMGIGLKQYARRLRLSHAIELADLEAEPNWAEIAVKAGFVDQPHLSNEVRELAGASPCVVLAERRAESAFYKTATA